MLTNYDAAAVAAVLGLAFVREGEADVGGNKRARHNKSASSDAGPFMVTVREAAPPPGRLQAPSSLLPPSSRLIEKAIETGFPRVVLRHVAQQLAGSDKSRVAALEWGVVPRTTLERREEQLSPQESERTERIARLFVQARRALGSEEEARQFMTTPHPRLDGRSPLEAARTDLGTRRVEQVLNALEYGLAL